MAVKTGTYEEHEESLCHCQQGGESIHQKHPACRSIWSPGITTLRKRRLKSGGQIQLAKPPALTSDGTESRARTGTTPTSRSCHHCDVHFAWLPCSCSPCKTTFTPWRAHACRCHSELLLIPSRPWPASARRAHRTPFLPCCPDGRLQDHQSG